VGASNLEGTSLSDRSLAFLSDRYTFDFTIDSTPALNSGCFLETVDCLLA